MQRRHIVTAAIALALCGITGSSSTASPSLAQQGRWLASHGGVTGTCAGCATAEMRSVARRLVVQRFAAAGSETLSWILCVVDHESGFNPGALNSISQAAGLTQIETQWHPEYDRGRLLRDPAYSVGATWRLSRGGHDRRPWQGGGYTCP